MFILAKCNFIRQSRSGMEILSAFIDCEADSAIDFSPLFPSVPLTLTKLFARQQRESAEK